MYTILEKMKRRLLKFRRMIKFLLQVDIPRGSSYNWLTRAVMNPLFIPACKKYARGILVDIGCADKPYEKLLSTYVEKYTGVDHESTVHDKSKIDIFATAYDTTVASGSVDTIISTCVLEHLEDPDQAFSEMNRILKSGGKVILTAPFFWLLHEQPRDFYRYTRYGLKHLCEKSGFRIVELEAANGWPATAALMTSYFLHYTAGDVLDRLFSNRKSTVARIVGSPILVAVTLLQCIGLVLECIFLDDFDVYTTNYLLVAEKPI